MRKIKMCRFVHDFGKWSDAYNGECVRSRGHFGDSSVDNVIMQERICKLCNYIEARVIRDGKKEKE